MAGHAGVQLVEIGVGGVLEGDAPLAQGFHGVEDVTGAQGYVLDALALIGAQELLDLGVLVLALVQGDADLAAGRGHGPGDQARLLALDIEVADLAEIEDALIEGRPPVHLAAVDVVGQVVEVGQPHAALGQGRRGALDRPEVDVIDLLGPIAVDQIEVRAADPLDGRDIQLHRPHRAPHRRRAPLHRQGQRPGGVLDPEGHGVGRGAMRLAELGRLARGIHVQDEVDVALLVADHVLGAVPGGGHKAQRLELTGHASRVGAGEFDELEAVGAQRIVEQLALRLLGGHGAPPDREPQA